MLPTQIGSAGCSESERGVPSLSEYAVRSMRETGLCRHCLLPRGIIMRAIVHGAVVVAITSWLAFASDAGEAGSEGWIALIGAQDLDAWRTPTGGWLVAGGARP